MKKAIIVILCIGLLMAAAIIAVIWKANSVMSEIEIEHAKIGDIALAGVADGVYRGTCGSIPVFVDLEVAVKDHAIQSVSINKQRCGKGYNAKDITKRIVEAQKVRVDGVSGATISSKCIMIAAYRALKSAGK